MIKYLLIIFSFVILTACASGSIVLTGTARQAIDPSQVRIYLEPPKTDFEVVGLIRASSEMGWTKQGSMDYAIEELRKQAARVGANGVILETTGERISGYIGNTSASGQMSGTTYSGFGTSYSSAVQEQIVSGRAIYIY